MDCFDNNFLGLLFVEFWEIFLFEYLSLGGNFFDGSIFFEYGWFLNFWYLGLNGNFLIGFILVEIGNLIGMELGF